MLISKDQKSNQTPLHFYPVTIIVMKYLSWNLFFCCCLKGVAATETRKQLQTIVLFIDNHTKLKTEFLLLYYAVVYEASRFFFIAGQNSARLHMQHVADCTWTFKTDS